MREPAREAHGLDDRFAHGPAAGQVRRVEIAEREHLLRGPLDLLPDERAGAVPADVVEGDAARGADRVVRELLAVDELLDADLRDVTEPRQRTLEVGVVLDAVGVERSGARDRLDDERVADALGGLPAPGDGRAPFGPRGADARGLEHLLHAALVPERHRLLHGEPRDADGLAEARREEHRRLPQRLHEVDVVAAQRLEHRGQRAVLVRPRRDLDVGGERVAGHVGQLVLGLVADTDDPRPDVGQTAGEEGHLAGVAGSDQDDVHQPVSTWMVVMSSARAASTVAVSGWRTITCPSPS